MANGTLKLKEKTAGDGVSQGDWNGLVRAVNMLLSMTGDGKYIRVNMRQAGPSVELIIGNLLGGSVIEFPAIITGHSDIITGAKWLYTFEEAEPTVTYSSGVDVSNVTYATKSGGKTGYAVNLAEQGNVTEPGSGTAWYLNDVDAHGTGYSATAFQLMPIGAGGTTTTHKVDRLVQMTQLVDPATGKTFYTFDRQNVHDGNCS